MTTNNTNKSIDNTISDNFSDENIFYVISILKNKIKKSKKLNVSEMPRLGKIKENDKLLSQSFCVADNLLVLYDYTVTSANSFSDVGLYYFIRLSGVKNILDNIDQKREKLLLNEGADLNEEDMWFFFCKKDITKYRVCYAKNEKDIRNKLKKYKKLMQPSVFFSYHDLIAIKEIMEKIQKGEEDCFNKVESISL